MKMKSQKFADLGLLFLVLLMPGCQKSKYPAGRDTKETFGDGRFQILRSHSDGREVYDLYDAGKSEATAMQCSSWMQQGNALYVIGRLPPMDMLRPNPPYWFVVHLDSGEVSKYASLAQVPPELQRMFKP